MKTLEQMSLREKIGQMIVTGFPTSNITQEMKDVIAEYNVGNVILFSHNVVNKNQLGDLVAELQQLFVTHTGVAGFITIDQEGGRVTRMPKDATNVAGAMAIASTGRSENAYAAGRITARELRALGINFNLAPVMDINNNPLNPVINVRSYGDTAESVCEYGIKMMRGLVDGGVLSSLKHFPGHGDTNVDSHIGLPTINKTIEELEQLELIPFREAIAQGAPAIMSSHILFPLIETSGLPATMSRVIITELLKEKLGFKGLVVSDCLEMDAIKRYYGTAQGAVGAVRAGVDLIFISHTPELVRDAVQAIEAAVAAGELDEGVIDAAVRNILSYKEQYATVEAPRPDLVGGTAHQAASSLMRTESISLVSGELSPISANDDNVHIIGTYSYRTDLASSSVNTDLNFAGHIGEKLGLKHQTLPIDPEQEQIDACVATVAAGDVVILGLFNARENTGQLALAQALIDKGIRTTIVALGRPYDLALVKGASGSLALLEYSADAFDSLIPILTGSYVPTAKLPIQL